MSEETVPLLKDRPHSIHDNGTFIQDQHQHPVDSDHAVPQPVQTRALISIILPLAVGIFLAAVALFLAVNHYLNLPDGSNNRRLL